MSKYPSKTSFHPWPTSDMCKSSMVTSSGDGEAIMHLKEVQFASRIGDAGLVIRLAAGDPGGQEVAAIPGIMAGLHAVRYR